MTLATAPQRGPWRIAGTESTAEQAADGTWTIRDVPIFADTERYFSLPGGKVIAYRVGGDWHERAIEAARKRYVETGYMARIKVGHGPDRESAGFFMPTRVGRMTLDGERKQVLYADYVAVPDAVFQRMLRHELPYRSVETPINGRAEVRALALLPDEPFHKLPPHTIASAKESLLSRRAGVVAFRRSGRVARLLVRFPMPETTTTPETTEKPGVVLSTSENTAAQTTATFEAAEPEKPETDGEEDESSMGAKLDEILGLLKRLAGEGSDANGGVAEMSESEAVANFQRENASLTAERDTLKGKVAAFEAKEARGASIAAAVAKIKGRDVGGDPSEKCAAFFDKGGQPALDAYTDAVLQFTAAEPNAEWTEEERAAKAAKATGAVDQDALFGAEYDALPDVKKRGITREQWISTAKKHPFNPAPVVTA